MTSQRPLCREEAREMGVGYPRSDCHRCGWGIGKGRIKDMCVRNKKFVLVINGPRDLKVPVNHIHRMVLDQFGNIPTLVVSGGARGVDTSAEDYARVYMIAHCEETAQWDVYDKAAGAIRNMAMAQRWHADGWLSIIPDNGKPITSGTASGIAEAVRAGINVKVVEYGDEYVRKMWEAEQDTLLRGM